MKTFYVLIILMVSTSIFYPQQSLNVTKYYSQKINAELHREILDIDIVESTLYLSDYYNGMLIYDLAEIFNPVYLQMLELGILGSNTIHNGSAFLCRRGNGISVYDVSSPVNPSKIGEWKSEYCDAQRIAFNDNLAVLANGFDSSVVTLNVQDPGNIEELGRLDIGNRVFDVVVNEDYAYLACFSGGLIIVDISNPEVLNAIDTLDYGIFRVAAYENYLLIPALSYARVDIYDISDPHNPQLISKTPTLDGSVRKAYMDDDYLYVLLSNGFEIYDIEDITHPLKVGYYYSEDVYSSSLLVKDQFIFYCARDLASGDDYSSQGDLFEIFHNESMEGTVTPPFAVNDMLTTIEDSSIVFASSDLLGNDFDLERDLLTIISIDTSGMIGTLDYNLAESDLTYNPMANYYGDDFFGYVLSDGNGGFDTASVKIEIASVYDKPVAVDDYVSTDEDNSITISLLTNDLDIEEYGIQAESINTSSTLGQVTFNQNNSTISYTPIPDFFGNDTLSYTITDGHEGGLDTARVFITVNSINDFPVAENDSTSTLEDTPVTINVLENDYDIENDTLLINSIISDSAGGNVRIDSSYTAIIYSPAANFFGDYSFFYFIIDGKGGVDSALVRISIAPVDDKPSAVNDTATVNEDSSVIIYVLNNDVELDGDQLLIQSIDTTGTIGGVTVNQGNTTLTYTPIQDYFGPDTLLYTITDGHIGGSDTAAVIVTVTSVNDLPVALDDNFSTAEDTSLTILISELLSNDTDTETETLLLQSIITSNTTGLVLIDIGDTSVTYTPEANFNGDDSFIYTIGDGDGGNDTATVFITVTSVNDNSIAVNDSVSTSEDNLVTITVLANDVDVDGDKLTILAVDADSTIGSVEIDAGDTAVTYTPEPAFHGNDSFVYVMTDRIGESDTAEVFVTVTSVNDAPIAVDDSVTTPEDTPVTFHVLTNDTDLEQDELVIQSVDTTGVNGELEINPGDSTITFTPEANFNGENSFSYTISDGNGGIDTAKVVVTVTPVNDAPLSFELTYPVDDATVDSTLVTFKWQTSVDPDLDEISYNFYLSGADKDTSIYDLPDTVLVFDGNTFLVANETYTWNVKATDGTDSTSCLVDCQFGTADVLVGLEDHDNMPKVYSLLQNYPNPFNPSTTINYELPEEAFVKITVYNLLGERVAVLVNEQKKAGRYEVKFNANNVTSGVYFYVLRSDNRSASSGQGFRDAKKMILLR